MKCFNYFFSNPKDLTKVKKHTLCIYQEKVNFKMKQPKFSNLNLMRTICVQI